MTFNKTTESYNDKKQIQGRIAGQILRHRDFGAFDYADLVNLLHPGFQGVRWTRDQPMQGSFPGPLTSQGKDLGDEVGAEKGISRHINF